MKIGLVQECSCSDITANLTAIRQYAAQAAQKGCSALCFPECFLTSYAPEEAAKLALSTENSYFEELSSIAAACSLDLLVGFMERENEAFFMLTVTG